MRGMPDPTIKHVRKRLNRFRGRYPEVCLRANLTYSWVSKLATGERGQRPSFELMNRLLSTLDAMEREARRSGRRRERVHAGTVRGRQTLGNTRKVVKARRATKRG